MAEAVGVEEEVIELTGTQKSAILMMLLGEDEAAEVLKNLSPREVQHLGTAMYSVATADQETVNSVLDEFLEIIKKQTSLGLGAGNYIRNVLQKALGDDKAQSVLSRITPASSERPIEILTSSTLFPHSVVFFTMRKFGLFSSSKECFQHFKCI